MVIILPIVIEMALIVNLKQIDTQTMEYLFCFVQSFILLLTYSRVI